MAGKTPTPSAPPPPLCAQTDTKPHQDTRRRPSYSHSVTAGTGPSGLKRGGAKTLHGTGETVYKRKVDSTALRGGAGETWGKLRQGKTLQQPSTQSDLESRPTGQAPGSRSKLLPEAAHASRPLAPLARSPVPNLEGGKPGRVVGVPAFTRGRLSRAPVRLKPPPPFLRRAAQASERKSCPSRVAITR